MTPAFIELSSDPMASPNPQNKKIPKIPNFFDNSLTPSNMAITSASPVLSFSKKHKIVEGCTTWLQSYLMSIDSRKTWLDN